MILAAGRRTNEGRRREEHNWYSKSLMAAVLLARFLMCGSGGRGHKGDSKEGGLATMLLARFIMLICGVAKRMATRRIARWNGRTEEQEGGVWQ